MANSDFSRYDAAPHGAQFISVISGKGGVGKSVLAFNLADRLVSIGSRVLLIDADFGCGNLHVLANAAAEFGIGEYASGQLSLTEATLSLTNGVDLLPATWHETLAEDRNVKFTAQLMSRLREDTARYNFVIFDHSSGRSNQAAMMAHASDVTLLVALPELTSLADCYGLYKHLLGLSDALTCRLVVNRIQTEEETEYISSKFAALTERFLRVPVRIVAAIPEDQTIRRAVAAQAPISHIDSQAPCCQALSELARLLSGQPEASQHENKSLIPIKKDPALADTRG